MNNYVIINSVAIPCSPRVKSFLIDYLCGVKTLIITKNHESRALWTNTIMRHLKINPMTPTGEESAKLMKYIDEHIRFLSFFDSNPDVGTILQNKFDDIIVEESWSLTNGSSVPSWLSQVKTENPTCRLFVCGYSSSRFIEDKVDQRFKPLHYVDFESFEKILDEDDNGRDEDFPPAINIHIFQKNVSSVSEVEPAVLRPFKSSSPKIFNSISCDDFADLVLSEEKSSDSFRCFGSLPRIIDVLDQAKRALSTAMVFKPSPVYGFRLTGIMSQINKLFDINSLKCINDAYVEFEGNKKHNLIFCNKGRSDLSTFRALCNWYIKNGFSNKAIMIAEDGYRKAEESTLCVEMAGYMPEAATVRKTNNVFVLGDWRYDSNFLASLIKLFRDDVNIIIPCIAKTADESNVAKTISRLDNKMFNVIKHDLSS